MCDIGSYEREMRWQRETSPFVEKQANLDLQRGREVQCRSQDNAHQVCAVFVDANKCLSKQCYSNVRLYLNLTSSSPPATKTAT
jgi:hypothetical protein